jgi:hypothetical protein
MTTRRIAVASLAFAALLTAAAFSSAAAQTGQPDLPGHGSAIQAPSEPASGVMTPGMPSFLMDGFSRMAMAVSHWGLAPQSHLAASRRATAGRTRVTR